MCILNFNTIYINLLLNEIKKFKIEPTLKGLLLNLLRLKFPEQTLMLLMQLQVTTAAFVF